MFSPEVPKADCSPKPPPPSVVATALHGLAELAAAGEAEAVARQVLCGSGTSPMDIDQLRACSISIAKLNFDCTHMKLQSSQLCRKEYHGCIR